MSDITNSSDLLDVRDIIARIEALEAEQPLDRDDDLAELDELKAFVEQLRGNGGDEQWDGDWFPGTLVRDSYFKDYAMDLAEDIGAINSDAKWPNNCIDWDKATRELRMDYTSAEFEGVTYWFR